MFWSGIVIGIFIGAALGILVMSMAVSAARNTPEEQFRSSYGIEASEELAPEVQERNELNKDKEKM